MRRANARWTAAFWLLTAAACAPSPSIPKPPGLAELRRAAAAKPQDARAQREVALAELFLPGGELARAGKAVELARSLDPHAPELALAKGLIADIHGHPPAAFDAYTEAIALAARTPGPTAQSILEAASYSVLGQNGMLRGYAEAGAQRLTPLFEQPGLSLAGRAALADVLVPLAQRRGDTVEVKRIAQRLGCATSYRVAGPFGPRALLGFDDALPVDLGRPIDDSYDLGPGRGVRATRTLNAQACAVLLGGGPVADAGTTLAETTLHAPSSGDYTLRLDTPNSVELFLDGRSVLRLDRRSVLGARVVFAKLALVAGDHRLVARVSSRHPNPVLEIAVAPYSEADAATLTPTAARPDAPATAKLTGVTSATGAASVAGAVAPGASSPAAANPVAAPAVPSPAAPSVKFPRGHTVPSDPLDSASVTGLSVYLRVALLLARGDLLSARQALSGATKSRDTSALLLLQRAGVALSDPLLPDGVRGDEARRYLTQAMARDSEAWGPVLQLASLAAKAGRVNEAISALRKAETQFPEVPAIGLALVELLRGKNFHAAADRTLARVRELVPDACAPLNAELEGMRSRERYGEVARLAEQLVRCDAESNALYSLYLERRDFAAAKRELERLRSLQPETGRYANLLGELALAKNLGDDKAAQSSIAELRARYPRSFTGAVEQIDRSLATGDKPAAVQALNSALQSEPAAMSGLYRVARGLGQPHVLAAYRKDGLAAIKAFEASGRKYDGPQVLVFDYMAARIFPDGSSLDLVHTVQKAQSDEAVDDLGEVAVPEGAQVLTLRAIKPDGRLLEADNIANKTSVSLPNVAPGDYVELEYLQANMPADGFPSGYLGDRFYFKSFEVPFDHSEMVVILPSDMPYQLDPRGAAPTPNVSVNDGLRVLDFSVDQSVPLVEEPNSVSAKEFIPSVRVGANATYEAMVESLRDVLADRDIFDPYYATLVREIVGQAAPNDYRLRAERLYSWVLSHIENQSDAFSQAALMLRAKAGNRARVLHYLLRLAGVPAQLALARSFTADSHDGKMADADTYDHLLLRVAAAPAADGGDPMRTDPIWLFANERWAPFGFMPAALRSQPALLLAKGAPRVRVSDGLLGPDTRRFAVNVSLQPDGAARVDVTETLHGGEAVAWRSQLEQIPQAELETRMEQDYVARLFPGASLVSLEISGREQDRPDLSLRYVADVKTFARPIGKGLALPPMLPSEISANLARTATRKTTEMIASPVRTEVDATIELPAGFSLAAAPAAESFAAAFAAKPAFYDKVVSDAKQLRWQRALAVPAMRIAVQDYPAFAEFCRRVDEVEGRELILRAH